MVINQSMEQATQRLATVLTGSPAIRWRASIWLCCVNAEIGKLAHRIAGIAGSVGFDDIGERASRVERCVIACRGSGTAHADKLHRITAELEPFLDLMETHLDG